jgi:hypothetical protein
MCVKRLFVRQTETGNYGVKTSVETGPFAFKRPTFSYENACKNTPKIHFI